MAKILVSIDDRLLAQVDRAAAESGLTRSAYLARLAARELGTESGPGASSGARRALTRLDRLFETQPVNEDPTVAIRSERDAR